MSKIKIGDKVTVLDNCGKYTTYRDMALKLVDESNGKAYKWEEGFGYELNQINLENYTGEVVAIGYDELCRECVLVNFELPNCKRSILYSGDALRVFRKFTFEEIIRDKIPGIYTNHNDSNSETIDIEVFKNGTFVIKVKPCNHPVSINESFEFDFGQVKKPYTLYCVKYKENGKLYSFRSKNNMPIDPCDFVICDTTQGKTYGRATGGYAKEMTEEEYLRYKECWKA